ncbi:MAG: HAD-IC family P-type ATPase [Thermoleophilaceae bacterium]
MHDLAVHEAVAVMDSDRERGLDEAEAQRRLERLGPNALPAARRQGPLVRLALQFHHPLIYILLGASAVTVAVGEPVDAAVILAVVLLNAAIGFVEESRAEHALEALASMVSAEATVVRDGERRRIPAREVVPGDLVVLTTGDAVVADLRLVEAGGLRIDESVLTGESLPASKGDAVLPEQTLVADRRNMAFAGTLVTTGDGRGLAVATGGDTEIGLIHRLMGEAVRVETPLTRKIAHFSHVLMWAILALAAATYGLGLARGEEPASLLVAVVALAVGAIPEGLPAAVTITLAIGVSRMAKRRAIVRRLPAVETLGSTTVICSDKTGTLTENQMTVQAIRAGGRDFALTGLGYRIEGEILPADEATRSATLRECLVAGALCNDAEVRTDGGQGDGAAPAGSDGDRVRVIGDPTEAALVVAARKAGLDLDRLAAELPRVDAIAFQSERRFMATLHRRGRASGGDGAGSLDGGGPAVAYVKGAVEQVLGMCSSAAGDGGPVPLDRDELLARALELGRRGLRVLALARGTRAAGDGFHGDAVGAELQLLGLQAMMDPPRAEAVAAVRACQSAGIAVKMITGDHVATAQAIAAQIGLDGGEGLAGEGAPRALTGAEIAARSAAELARAVPRTAVFARVSPEQKLTLVRALQTAGEIVAMTGDGVNDAPALKRADIGVAMGRDGTEVARDAADIVLTDDNFASIESAVEEGRRTFDNLTKFIVWTLPTNMAEGLLVLAAIVAGATLPILPTQILWINMTSAVALGLMLAFERREPGIMTRPPRDPGRPILTRDLVGRILLVSGLLLAGAFGLFEWAQDRGMSDAEARTVAVNVFVTGELFYLFNCRSLDRSMLHVGLLSNRWAIAGVLSMIVLQALFTYAQAMNALFDSAPIGWDAWQRILLFGLAVWGIVGAEKWVRRQRQAVGSPPRKAALASR